MYYEGLGVQENHQKSFSYWKSASENGDKDATHNLKILCESEPEVCK